MLGILFVIILAIISLSTGTGQMALGNILKNEASFREWQIFVQSRIPRTVALILSGASMAVTGLIMQMLVQNRFVEPSTTGITESAGLGILIVTIYHPTSSIMFKMCFAVLFALVGTFTLITIIRSIPNRDIVVVPLLGLTFSGIVGALATFLAWKYTLQGTLHAWYLGDFSGVIKGRYELLYLAAMAAIISYFFADMFTIASLGEDMARSLGLNQRKVILIGLLIVAVVTGITTIVAGTLPFLGIVVPNIVSLIFGDFVRKSLPFVALGGATFVLCADILSRSLIAPSEIPVGVIMGVLGAGLFLFVLLRSQPHEN